MIGDATVILKGRYFEHMPGGYALLRNTGQVVFRKPTALHRLSLFPGDTEVWSLFLTGPRIRTWGFQCPQGWRPWHEFVDSRDTGKVGRGCG